MLENAVNDDKREDGYAIIFLIHARIMVWNQGKRI